MRRSGAVVVPYPLASCLASGPPVRVVPGPVLFERWASPVDACVSMGWLWWWVCPSRRLVPYRAAPARARWSPQLEERPCPGGGGGLVACGARRVDPAPCPERRGSGAEPLAAGGAFVWRRRRRCGAVPGAGPRAVAAHAGGSGHAALARRVRVTPGRNVGVGLVVRADRGRDRRAARPGGPRLDPNERKSAISPRVRRVDFLRGLHANPVEVLGIGGSSP